MVSTYPSAAIVTMDGVDYDPLSVQLTKDNSWSPTYQAQCTIATADLVAPTLAAATNLMTNPSAAVDLTGAVGTSLTLTRQATAAGFATAHGTAYRLTGTNSSFGQITVGGGSGGMRLGMVAGKTYTASGTFYTDVALSGSANAYARSIVVNVVVGGVQSILAASAQAPNTNSTQTRLAVTFTIPANATAAWIEWYHGHASTSVAYWTDLMLVAGNGTDVGGAPLPYFDGDDLDTVRYQYDWTGTAHASTSTRTPVFVSTSTTPIVDPRLYPKVRVRQWAGADDAGASLLLYDVLMTVRTYVIDDIEDKVTLTLSSDEVKLQDYANVGADYAPGAMTINDMMAFAMRKIGETRFIPGIPDVNATIPASATVWRAGQTLDDWLLGAARSLGYEIWYDPSRRPTTGETNGWAWYRLDNSGREPGSAGGSALNFAYGKNIIQSALGVDMDSGSYADAVVMIYQWTDSAGASQRQAFYGRPSGAFHKVKTINYQSAAPGGDPSVYMRWRLAQQGWTQRLVGIASPGYIRQVAPNPAVPIVGMPLGGTVLITRRDGSTWSSVLSRITYRYPEDTQEVGVESMRPAPGGPGTDFAYYPIPGS